MPNAYRRDETVKVEVKSNDVDVDPASVRVAVTGTGAAWDAGMPVEVTSGCDAAYCGELAQMPLSGPEMKAYHTAFTVAASGMDDGGNPGKLLDAGSLDVTRFKWTFTAPDGFHIVASPAIGRDGTVYVGTADPSTTAKGTLYAVSPDGHERWKMDAGAVEVSPAVGADAGGYEHVFVAGADGVGTGNMWALDSRDGGVLRVCDGTVRPVAAPAISTTSFNGTPFDTATMGGSNKALYAFRPDIGDASAFCLATLSPLATVPSGNVVVSGSRFFVPGSSSAEIDWADFGATGWTGPNSIATTTTPGTLALSGSRFLYSMAAGVGAIGTDGSAFDQSTLSGAPSFGPVIASDTKGYVGASAGLVNVPLANLSNSSLLTPGAGGKASPVLGEGNWLFVSAGSGFQAWQQGGPSFEWQASDAGISAADVPLSIDCTRDDAGTAIPAPGVVYVKSGSTSLTAIVVDSHGIDITAPWPKYQHDPRNTGNVDTLMTEFACP